LDTRLFSAIIKTPTGKSYWVFIERR